MTVLEPPPEVSLSVHIGSIRLRNCVILASGTCGVVDEMAEVIDLSQVGALTGKSITREPRDGNAPCRIVGVPSGMMNAIGLANPGLVGFTTIHAPRIGSLGCPYIASVAGHSIDDYVFVASALGCRSDIGLIELNVSCPNTSTGRNFGDDPAALRSLLRAVRSTLTNASMIVKLAPNAPDVSALAAVAVEEGACALTLCNTLPSPAIHPASGLPILAQGSGGLSGPVVHELAVRVVGEVYRTVAKSSGTPIIGLGGVMRASDAAEFILAGATAVGMGTALFADPRSPLRVIEGLRKWVASQGCSHVGELTGAMHT